MPPQTLPIEHARRRLRKKRGEESIQQATIKWLRAHGYDVHQTTVRVRKCEQCGLYPKKAHYGADKGVADLLVRGPNWPRLVNISIEMKGDKTPLSPEQKELERAGAIAIARSPEEALFIVQQWERDNLERDA